MGGSPLVVTGEFPCTLGPSCGGVWAASLSSPSGGDMTRHVTRLPLPSGTLHRHTYEFCSEPVVRPCGGAADNLTMSLLTVICRLVYVKTKFMPWTVDGDCVGDKHLTHALEILHTAP